MPDNANPLRKFFRQPAIYIKLPSGGNFYPKGSLDMPPNQELPVYPMTAMDEITYRTADALFNGTALVNVIKSCVPNIKDPWKVPNMDIDTILVGIRIATYGHDMEFESSCPHCAEENAFGLDLRTVLDSISAPDYGTHVTTGDVEIYFKPLSYEEINQNSIAQFEDQKLLELLPNADISEAEKVRRINEAFTKLTMMTMSAISSSIAMIKAGSEIVVEPEYILEFVTNCDRDTFSKIREHVVGLKEQGELKPLNITCRNHECQKSYETPFTLNVSNFFEVAS